MSDKTVVIMGAGFAGLAAAIQFQKKYPNTPLKIYEKGHDVGGSWRDNTYPGCGCDVVSHYYSLSSSPNPSWTKEYSLQPEIFQYLRDTAARNNLLKLIEFNTKVVDGVWDEVGQKYHLTIDRLDKEGNVLKSEKVEAHIVVSAVGIFDIPVLPNIKGIETFKGDLFHSMRWRSDVSLKGKRVAVIGNGASATQIVPAISEDKSTEVINFVRNPNWFAPRAQFKFSPTAIWLFNYLPFAALLYRWFHYIKADFLWIFWQKDNIWARRLIHWQSSKYIRETAPAKYHDKLIPTFNFGCKRLIRDPEYLASLHRKNVDMEWEPIQEIVEDGIVMKDGRKHVFDVIIPCTGFDVAGNLMPFTGLHGRTMAQYWDEQGGPIAHKSTTQPDLPNYFTVLGPNSGNGHASAIFSQEVDVDLIIQLVKPILTGKADAVKPTHAATKKYNDYIQGLMKKTVWDGCSSYYNQHGGRNHSMFPSSATYYWWYLRRPVWSEYDVTPSKRVKAE